MIYEKYVIGIDYGTDSVRGMLVNAMNGQELASSVFFYPRWREGLYCDAAKKQFRQHPLDYIEGLEHVVNDCIDNVDEKVSGRIAAISFATTGSTPCPVNSEGIPLALLEEFADDPDAMFHLWKDHTAIEEAEIFNATARKYHLDYLKYVGGNYSPEWYWAKLLHTTRKNERVANAAFTWVEHSDWMSFLLTGGEDASKIKRNICAAGHKGLWAEEFGGLPPVDFFTKVDPCLEKFVYHYGDKTYTADHAAGTINKEWAQRLHLPDDVIVGMGAIDAHIGAVGAGIQPYQMTKVMGTSTCDMVVVPEQDMEGVFIKGISGQVHGSIIPDMVGLEAGQSAFGDVYQWLIDLLMWSWSQAYDLSDNERNELELIRKKVKDNLIKKLTSEAEKIELNDCSEFALDWLNGRRTPDLNPDLKGMIAGLTLGSGPAKIYRALVEATCFGSKAIMEAFESQGVRIQSVKAIGGIAQKSDFVMQMMADILGREVQVIAEEQTVALGACMYAGVVARVYQNAEQASAAMGKEISKVYIPNQKLHATYQERYPRYKAYGV